MEKYKPETWEFTINKENGRKIYKDDILNKVQQNLYTLFDLIDSVRVDCNTELLYVQNNINTKTVKDPTVKIVAFFASKVIEGLGVIFTAGTAAAIVSTILFKLTSGLITHLCNPESKDSYNKIQGKVNDIKLAMDEIFKQTQLQITKIVENLESQWNVEFKVSINSDEVITTSELSNCDFFPLKESSDFVYARESLVKNCVYIMTKELLPVKWRVKKQRAFPTDGFANILCGWQVEYYKVYNRETWNKWRSRKDFPNIPNDLKGDIEGPYTPDEQVFMAWSQSSKDYKKSDSMESRWMNWSGRNKKIEINNDIIKGTSFLDLIQDILSGEYFSSGEFSYESGFPDYHSYFLWYKTKRSNENIEVINDKRHWTLIGNDACNDWVYDSNSIFTWGRAYRGITLHHYYLIDENGGHASEELCNWLFKDNGHYFDTIYLKDGNIVKGYITNKDDKEVCITDIKPVGYHSRNKYKLKLEEIDKIINNETIINDNGIATKNDVYNNWLLPVEKYSVTLRKKNKLCLKKIYYKIIDKLK
jgi:hypothetical protein